MKRIILNLDALSVESFDTQPRSVPAAGTVYAHGGLTSPDATCISEVECTGDWCQGQSGLPCGAGTYGGRTCLTTCKQVICGCTNGHPDGTCDASCGGTCGAESCPPACPSYFNGDPC